MKFVEKTAKTVDEAVTEALIELGASSDQVKVEIVDKGTPGLFGLFGAKPATVKVIKKMSIEEVAEKFLQDVFLQMGLDSDLKVTMDDKSNMNIEISGANMGVLIGKRGQTLDSLQYLVSLVVNKEADQYIRVKMDTEDYRDRRRKTLESLAVNLANKVKKTGKRFVLEPMNPYERRIIHSTLQGNKFVETHSEGDEPFRKVVITPAKK
ncbi:RNA-binding cell elongation regulator Jag/EloR [Anaerotalea alkaliphila]|uniref:RNA-binding protein KhpB n=1 Tax=Anaerotalea alkaliphila TaxID=2662126 RepID=A0A7X5KMK6_9FIRM|nr:RNA-binding cell elongation regulator Jag/EloR [Anaerotalea alkaliphila]NDL68086.1 protein jag [Anaerotalea alkaliphila]